MEAFGQVFAVLFVLALLAGTVYGLAVRPGLYREDLADRVVHVTDLECVTGCRLLALREAIVAGASSGGVIMAVDRLRRTVPAGAVCVTILADRGERYLDTVYSDDWVGERFGDVSYLWEEVQEACHA